MTTRKRSPEEVEASKKLAVEFYQFRKEFKFTQKQLAETIGKGLCRRGVQMIEKGLVIRPNPDMVRRFRELVQKHQTRGFLTK